MKNNSRIIIKEGLVNYISVSENGEQRCEKCRLVLVKTSNESGPLLEFYSPAKSFRPKYGLFCFLINEIRPIKPIEMPERPFTFLLKFSNVNEYIIEAQNELDLLEWLKTIKQQINGIADEQSLGSNKESYSMLKNYPWFHRDISRYQASELVLKGGEKWSGVFLLRQSVTKADQYVLTFNFQGNAKHLRIMIQPEGHCQIEQTCFKSIFNLLEHFRLHPIPMKSDQTVQLTDFVIYNEELLNIFNPQNQNHFRNSIFNIINHHQPKIKLFNGCVRFTTQELNLLNNK